MIKKLAALLLPVFFLLPIQKAGAQQAYQLGWWLKASGSAQVVIQANHIWSELYDPWGNYQGRGFDFWIDLYCQINSVTSGDNLGTPIRIQFAAPYGWDSGCLPGLYQSQYYGWTNGLGGYSGQNFINPYHVQMYESYVFPRSSTNSRGTTLEIY